MADENKTHPLRITDKYPAQFDRADFDLPGRRADEEQMDALREGAANGPQPHEAMEEFAQAWEAELLRYATEPEAKDGEHLVHDAIGQAVASAGARVEASSLTSEQRLAKAIAVELKAAQGDDELYDAATGPNPPSPAETAALEAELADEDLAWLDAQSDDEWT